MLGLACARANGLGQFAGQGPSFHGAARPQGYSHCNEAGNCATLLWTRFWSDAYGTIYQDDARLEKPLEAKLVTQWSEMLDDSNAEVQNESTNCIPPLLAIVTPVHVTKIVQSLVDNLLKGTECQRDIAAIGTLALVRCGHDSSVLSHKNRDTGLQNVVRSLGPESAQTKQICVSLVEQTMVALTSESEDSLILEILDLFLEVALRMGKGLAPHHNKMSAAFFDMLAHPRMAVRKRAVRAFGAMVPAVEDALFGEIVTHVAERLGTPRPPV